MTTLYCDARSPTGKGVSPLRGIVHSAGEIVHEQGDAMKKARFRGLLFVEQPPDASAICKVRPAAVHSRGAPSRRRGAA
ncbi:hypothetical protein [Noviherbaspirillum aridicola]|uniref:hypothetical protein n=1 Tax=Noviherbaspirillum aridicola TaxID=2849687 RepID=UPI001C7E357B|nr:hypothetical protein [Noviherbaspirillum aridicola]